jgi:hypothetical protein
MSHEDRGLSHTRHGMHIQLAVMDSHPWKAEMNLEPLKLPLMIEIRCPKCKATLLVRKTRGVCRCELCRSIIRPCEECQNKQSTRCATCHMDNGHIEESTLITRRAAP